MRKCLRCEEEMVENLTVKAGGYSVIITQHGFLKDSLGKIKCAVCPKCGYAENYIEDMPKAKTLDK